MACSIFLRWAVSIVADGDGGDWWTIDNNGDGMMTVTRSMRW